MNTNVKILKDHKGFIGAEKISALPEKKRVGVKLLESGIAREGALLFAGDEQIGMAVAFNVGEDRGQAEEAFGIVDAGLLGDFREGAVAVVVEEIVAITFQSGGTALNGYTVILAGLAGAEFWKIVEVKIDIVGDEEVGPSIAVVIPKGSAGGPTVGAC